MNCRKSDLAEMSGILDQAMMKCFTPVFARKRDKNPFVGGAASPNHEPSKPWRLDRKTTRHR